MRMMTIITILLVLLVILLLLLIIALMKMIMPMIIKTKTREFYSMLHSLIRSLFAK